MERERVLAQGGHKRAAADVEAVAGVVVGAAAAAAEECENAVEDA